MCEYKRLITVEIQHDIFITRQFDILYCRYAVVPVSAYQYFRGRGDLSDSLNTGVCNSIPGLAVRGVCHFIQKFKSDSVAISSEPFGKLLPEPVETLLQLLIRRVRAEDPENVMRQGMPVTIFVDTAAP